MRHALSLAIVTSFVTVLTAQDSQYVQALTRAQSQRPAVLSPVARIAPESEPGTPLVIRGRLFAADGKTAIPNATIFAYHTDNSGLYDKAGSPPHSWRLRGWALTSPDGSFEFRTIRPGPYPGNRIPAHVHFTVYTADARYHAGELRFEDDRLVPDNERQAAKDAGQFGGVRPVRVDGGTQFVEFAIKINPSERF
jgi:protocatechuate 3,4-dioxygenase, beta subunit